MESLKQNIAGCRRCGTCCRKGGPALHLKDRDLVESGHIALACLSTIRRGEPAFNNVTAHLEPAPTDIIKIKPVRPDQTVCVYYKQEMPGCSIYDRRPLECRALQCWNPGKIKVLYNRDRLTREHLLAGQTELWDLVAEHQNRCDYERLAHLAAQLKQTPDAPQCATAVLAMLRYDYSLRETVKTRTGLPPDLFDFLFGRPLAETLAFFSLKLVKSSIAGGYQINVGR